MRYSILFYMLFSTFIFSQQTVFSELSGPYFGQTPPGRVPVRFSSDLLADFGPQSHIVFSPDGNEMLCSVSAPVVSQAGSKGGYRDLVVLYSRMEDGRWTEPVEFLPGRGYAFRYPSFSPDGNQILINPVGRSGIDPKSCSGIWIFTRQGNGWSEPDEIRFGEEYQGPTAVYPSMAACGNLYFALFPDGVNGYLYMSRFENGGYSIPERLSETINECGANHPYIAPDESYLLFDSERHSQCPGWSDLYISYRDDNGDWMDPVHLGEGINTIHDERRPFVSSDGKYLFFVSNRNGPAEPGGSSAREDLRVRNNLSAGRTRHVYWVSAEVIRDCRENRNK